MVSHDLEVAQYADRIIHMRDGKVIKITEGDAAIKELTKAEEIIEGLPDIGSAKILDDKDTEEK